MGGRVRGKRIAAVVAALAVSTALVALARPASAAPALDVPVTTVAVGQPLVFTATDCPAASDGEVEQFVDGGLVVGSGADAVRAGIVDTGASEGTFEVIPMGWVDPDEPAVLSVRCVRSTIDGPATVLFAYPEVAIDVVAPAAPVPTLDAAFDRVTAAGGQAIRVTGSGCEAQAILQLYAGTDLTFRTTLADDVAAFQDLEVADDGTFDGLLYLNDVEGPLVEGPYVVSTYCDHVPEDRDLARPVQLTVDGTNPSDQIELALGGDGRATLSGGGCTSGRLVTTRWVGMLAEPTEGDTVEVHGEATATPSAEGAWSLPLGDGTWDWIEVATDCGDPTADGFHYLDTDAVGALPESTTTTSTTSPGAAPAATDPSPATPVAAAPTYTG